MSLKIEAGKLYRTRDGKKARVYATDGSADSIHGAFLTDRGWYLDCWYSDGTRTRNGNSTAPLDLISEWIDLPEVDWDAMPKWANWVAMDSDGRWWFFVEKPKMNEVLWSADGGMEVTGFVPKANEPAFSGDWKQSLVQRPESK